MKPNLIIDSNKFYSKKQNRSNYNLVYMAKPPYGGWVSFTAHLSKKFNYDLFKIGNKTEKNKRPYGYEVMYQNLSIEELLKTDTKKQIFLKVPLRE